MGVCLLSNNIVDYKHYKTNRTKSKQNFDRLFKIASLVFCILMTLMFASIMGGGFLIHAGNPDGGINMEAREYYAISFGSFGTLTEAEKAASSLRARGGGGYVHKGNKHQVFAALYINNADAESVYRRLKNSDIDCSVQKIEIPSYKFRYEGDKTSSKKVKDTLEIFNFTLESLYTLFVEIDGNIISELDAQVRLNALKNEIARRKSEYESLDTSSSHQSIRLKAELMSLQINLGIIAEASYLSENTGIEIKFYMLKIAFSYQSFVMEIK